MFFEWDSVSICNFFDCYRFLANFAVKSVMQWVAWGSYRAPDFYSYVIINVWHTMENQAHKTPSGIHQGRKSVRIRVIRNICVLSLIDGLFFCAWIINSELLRTETNSSSRSMF